MKELVNIFVKDPFEGLGYVILAIIMVGLVARTAKHVWNQIVSDED
jgi:hypothetical protein